MKITVIVAEFNPLHNGHKYLIDYAKNYLRSDYIITTMSGDFTQRGTPALLDKYTRADIAIHEGVDLVIEIPSIAATSSADYFCESGFYALRNTGIVTDLIFGAETAGINLFEKAARILNDEPELMSTDISNFMRQGFTYPQAVAKALKNVTNDEKYVSLFSSANNLLGIYYMRHLLKSKAYILPHCVSRNFVNHHERKIDMNFTSSTNIRELVKAHDLSRLSAVMPEYSYEKLLEKYHANEIVFEDDFSSILHSKLYELKKFDKYADINSDLSNRIMNERDEFISFSSFVRTMTPKNVTASRISRALCHIYLNMTETEREKFRDAHFCPYLHILGFSERGAKLLSCMKTRALVPFFVEYSETKSFNNKTAIHSLNQDIFCSDLYRVIQTQKTGKHIERETSRKFSITNVRN